MATLADLRTRIIADTNRSDLGGDLASRLDQAISDAIGVYADTRFYFNELRVQSALVKGQQFQTVPVGTRKIDKFYVVVGGVSYWLRRISMEEMESLYTAPSAGQPTDFAVLSGQARVWPTPSFAYPTIWLTVADVTPVIDFTAPTTNGTTSNSWTNDGQWLIAAAAEAMLYRDVFRDTEGYVSAAKSEADAYRSLAMQSVNLVNTGRVKARW